MPSRPYIRRRFTLIELLVVVSIILVLAALLVPALATARQVAYQAKCLSNSRQCTIALTIAAEEDDDQLISRYSSPDPKYSMNGIVGTGAPGQTSTGNFNYYQWYLADNYLMDPSVMTCPAESSKFIKDTLWSGTYFAHMGVVAYPDYQNLMNGASPWHRGDTWGRGHWDAPRHDRYRVNRIVNPENKLSWIDSHTRDHGAVSTNPNHPANGVTHSGIAYNFIIHNYPYIRHRGGFNAIMWDGHGQYMRMADIGPPGSYAVPQKRYFAALNLKN